jgi:hypothetical protein
MPMRASLTGWMIITAVLALSAGALAGSGEVRMSGMEGRLAALQALVADRDALVASLTAELDQFRDRVDTSHMETQAAEAALRVNRVLLDDAAHRLYEAEATTARQRDELRILKQCLTGAMQALRTIAEGDAFGAMHTMMTVDGECRAAQGLLDADTSVE